MTKKVKANNFKDAFETTIFVGDRVAYIYTLYDHKTKLVSGVVEKIEEVDDSYQYKWNIHIRPDDPNQGYSKNQRPSILHFPDKIILMDN